jgi:hypothetical protein
MIKKISFILISFFLIRFISSCCEEGYKFQWSRIDLNNITGIKSDNPTIITSDSCDFNEYGFRISFSHTKIAGLLNNIGFTTAKAFDCEPLYSNSNKIIKYSIISLVDYNSTYKIGTDISDIIEGREIDFKRFTPNKGFVNIDSIVAIVNMIQGGKFNDYSLDCKLKESPDKDKELLIAVKFEFENGNILTDTTKMVKIKI